MKTYSRKNVTRGILEGVAALEIVIFIASVLLAVTGVI